MHETLDARKKTRHDTAGYEGNLIICILPLYKTDIASPQQ